MNRSVARRLSRSLILTILLAATTVLAGAQEAKATDLKILSWNVYMLPSPLKISLQKDRTDDIVAKLAATDYDALFFQEAFSSYFRDLMIKKLGKKYPYSYYLKRDKKLTHILGSGVFVMSRLPMKVLDRVYYKECGGFDCFAAKGAVLVELQTPSKERVQFAVTHLQSSLKETKDRLSQLEQIHGMFADYASKSVPQFLIGDLNIIGKTTEFKVALRVSQMEAAPLLGPIQWTSGRVNNCYKIPGNTQDWIDHLWMKPSSKVRAAGMTVRNFEFVHKGQRCPDSDHYAMESRIRLY